MLSVNAKRCQKFLYPCFISSLSFVSFNVFVNYLVASYNVSCFLSIGCLFVRMLFVDEHSEVQAPGRVLGNADRLAKVLHPSSLCHHKSDLSVGSISHV